jgi:hypothetical protein
MTIDSYQVIFKGMKRGGSHEKGIIDMIDDACTHILVDPRARPGRNG